MAAFISRRRPRRQIELTTPSRESARHIVRAVPSFLSWGADVADLWYYGRGAELFGPFSGWQVAELADAGEVLRTDTVWEDGSEDGVSASCIPHLFPVAAEKPPAEKPPATKEPLPALSVYPARPSTGQRRAVAGPGAIIRGQNGKTVQYTKKCTTCGKEDRCTSTATIVAGTMRFGFFCPKCRRQRPVEIQGR